MRKFKRILKRSLLLALVLILVLTPVVYAQTWAFRFPTSIEDTSGTGRLYYPALLGWGGTALVDAGKINANGLDTNMQIGSSSIKYMLSTAETGAVLPNLPAGGLVTTNFYTGYAPAQTEFAIVVGEGGFITTPDAAALEPAADFQIEHSGYVDTSVGANKNLVYKQEAFRTYVSDATDITSRIGALAQPIVGGFENTLNPAAVEYNSLMGGGTWTGTENIIWQVIPTGGAIDGLYVRLSAAPGAGDSYTFTLMVNGAPTALAVTISGAVDTTGNDWGAIPVVAGDTVSIRSEFAGAPAVVQAAWTTNWTPTIEGESICLIHLESNPAATVFGEIQGKNSLQIAVETRVQAPLPTAGTFKKLYVQLHQSPGVAPDAYSFTLRDAAADTALTLTITAPDTTGNDAVNTVAVAAGALVDIEITPLNAPANATEAAIGMVFVSDTSGESLIMGGTGWDTPTVPATEYLFLGGTGEEDWNAVEANMYSLTQSATLQKLYVSLETAPGGVETYTVSIREAGGDTGLTVTITGAAIAGNDVVNTYASLDGDVADTRMVSSAAAAATRIHWGLVAQNPSVMVTATGVASGEHVVLTTYDGADLKIFIDTIEEDSTAWVGSVPDNANDWIWNQNEVMPFIDYITEEVSSVAVLEYEPPAMIGGTDYTTGTAVFTNGSATVTGVGTTWDNTMVSGAIRYDADALWVNILSVESTTSLTLTAVYGGAGGGAAAYTMATLMPNNESAGLYFGVVTWGANTNTTITYGEMVSYESTTASATAEAGFEMPTSPLPATWFASGENVANLPLYDAVNAVATDLGMPVVMLYFWWIIGLAFGTALLLIVFTRSALFGVMGMTIVLFIGSSMTIVPMWMPVIILMVDIGIMYLYRQVSY